ncbi:unnamed protein product [Protopolystoma xenopodis]|uniref:WD repeat-containing protein 44 n=1 Tax=Protopolystoma xenopodis TaxID=117903 RepID=A0A448WYX1_9PLAT|nr:unnamed protein product [Protopolystoma xenopodis]
MADALPGQPKRRLLSCSHNAHSSTTADRGLQARVLNSEEGQVLETMPSTSATVPASLPVCGSFDLAHESRQDASNGQHSYNVYHSHNMPQRHSHHLPQPTAQSHHSQIERKTPFRSKPLLVYRGPDGVITEVAWSKNLFLLATSMDRQVRLWHISRRECLCVFSHHDTVPTIVFHPKPIYNIVYLVPFDYWPLAQDDRYFLSGSLDGKLRLWNIPDKKVCFWVEVPLPSALAHPAPSSLSSSASAAVSGLFFKTSSSFPSGYLASAVSASGEACNELNLTGPGVAVTSGLAPETANEPKTLITCATFACEGTKVVVGSYDGRVLFFNSEVSYCAQTAISTY